MRHQPLSVQRAFRLLVWSIGLLFLLMGLLVLFGYLDAKRARRSLAHQAVLTCIAVNNINVLMTQTLERNQRLLPKLSFYQDHPLDLQLQLEEIEVQKEAFRPRTCPTEKP